MGDKLSQTLLKPVLSGAAGAIIASMYYGETGYAQIFGMRVSVPLLFFGSIAASDYLGEVLKNYALPYIPQDSSYSNLEGMILAPVLSGASLVVLLGPLTGITESSQYGSIFMTGALAVGAGSYAYSAIPSSTY